MWSVVYDLAAAVAAFFLLAWMIQATSTEQRAGIAEFLAPDLDRPRPADSATFVSLERGPSGPLFARREESGPEGPRSNAGETPAVQGEPSLEIARAIRDSAQFSRAEIAIRQAMQDMPEELSRQVIIEQSPTGLRIQIVDREGRSMFAPGASEPNPNARRLLGAVSEAIAPLPNRLSISGHTESTPRPRTGLNNWELSAARADAARRLIEAHGVAAARIYEIAGRAAAEPLLPDPSLPGNRRIAITLLREASASGGF